MTLDDVFRTRMEHLRVVGKAPVAIHMTYHQYCELRASLPRPDYMHFPRDPNEPPEIMGMKIIIERPDHED